MYIYVAMCVSGCVGVCVCARALAVSRLAIHDMRTSLTYADVC